MKALLLTAAFVCLTGLSVFAQRFAYYDSEYILQHIPDYIAAQKQLDALSRQWQTEVEARFAEIDKLNRAFQADQVLLTDDMRKRRLTEISDKEKEARDFQNSKFGYQKELYQQNIRLVKPIQDRVAKAIQAVMETLQLDMFFDKNSEAMLFYASPRLDKSNDVVTRLGYKPGNFAEKVVK